MKNLSRLLCLGILSGSVLVSEGAYACVSVSDEVARRIEDSYKRDRRRADVVVLGTWVSDPSHESCGGDENLCRAKIIPDKILKGTKLSEYHLSYRDEVNLCDGRNWPPPTGTYGKYYIDGNDERGFSLVDKILKDKK